jgi:hypothetical protein
LADRHLGHDLERPLPLVVVEDVRSSSALVRRTNASSPSRTVAGAPTMAQASESASIARAYGSSIASRPSTGGGSFPGRPLRMFRNDCCNDENKNPASASVSAAVMLTPSIT